MVDGKVINFATDNSATLRCNICRQTYKDFKNDMAKIHRHPRTARRADGKAILWPNIAATVGLNGIDGSHPGF